MRRSLLHRLTGLFLLLAHAIAGTSALPAITTLAADLEGSHAVMVSRSEQGTQVVLHHREHEYTPAVEDHANVVARVIVRLCSSSQEGDHRLSTEALSSGLTEETVKQVRAKKQAECDSFMSCQPWMPQACLLTANTFSNDIQRSHVATLRSIQVMLRSVRLMV
ncbi:hypothetical protein [Brevifollis gellanilyticus]|uniref:Uncharacterized protein n=1 Tax=Brevifollis gellanilyticus TaxID=748831 RepID=A0A512M238_9BACT|nr:hypothetical protein [Brevifollis gellanilyticus]GEP40806.1 hypothetical protein BGE01nite_00970 [Brevifollis gellanilyticus]